MIQIRKFFLILNFFFPFTLTKKYEQVLIIFLFFPACLFAGSFSSENNNYIRKSLFFFNSSRAFKDIEKQCFFGPRPPGTKAHEKCREYLIGEFKKIGLDVRLQSFTGKQGTGKGIEFTNIIASFPEKKALGPLNYNSRKIVFAAHYDTRPFAEKDLFYPEFPIPGANDGASGTAVVLETARFFSDYRLKKILKSINNSKFKSSQNYTCEFILFDGEDYGLGTENMFYGSRYLANNYELENIEFLILFDMVGDSDLQFYYELNSLDSAPKILKAIFESASEIGYSDFFIPKKKYRIFDDHLPFIEKGVKAVNIIDFDYPFWHTLQDDVSKTDALSLEVTGRSVLYYLLKNYKFDIQ